MPRFVGGQVKLACAHLYPPCKIERLRHGYSVSAAPRLSLKNGDVRKGE